MSLASKLELLPRLYQTVFIPGAVAQELERGAQGGHDAPDVGGLSWLRVIQVQVSEELQRKRLDGGEREAIALALQTPGCRILLDDRAARQEAEARGLLVTGTIAVLSQAKQRGLLGAVKPFLDRLPELGFRISPKVLQSVLQELGES